MQQQPRDCISVLDGHMLVLQMRNSATMNGINNIKIIFQAVSNVISQFSNIHQKRKISDSAMSCTEESQLSVCTSTADSTN
jgi:hypothetical protein